MAKINEIHPIDKTRVRKIKGDVSSFGATEHRYRAFEKELKKQTDYLYHKLCLDADDWGMSKNSILGLKRRLGLSHRSIINGLKELAHWGLILYEYREDDGYVVQVLGVPNYDLMKQRHITVNVTTVKTVMTKEQYENIMHEFELQLTNQPSGSMKDFVWKRMHEVQKEWEETQKSAEHKKK